MTKAGGILLPAERHQQRLQPDRHSSARPIAQEQRPDVPSHGKDMQTYTPLTFLPLKGEPARKAFSTSSTAIPALPIIRCQTSFCQWISQGDGFAHQDGPIPVILLLFAHDSPASIK